MRILFNSRWTPELLASPAADPEQVQAFLDLEKTAQRVDAATYRTFVWARVEGLDATKYLVSDVRICCETHELTDGWFAEVERLQVLILEGWKTPERIWTDEEDIEVIETVQ